MPCYHPLEGWWSKDRHPTTRKRTVTFRHAEGYTDRKVAVPCGRCIGCRLERSRQWATRCMHEASLHEDNVFLTLTYNGGNLPTTTTGLATLEPRHFQLFMKRLRKARNAGIKYFQAGEYGDQLARPHHHAILFGVDFPDRVRLAGGTHSEQTLYRSDELDLLWPHGFASIGNVTFESAAYVARYTLKKITGPKAPEHYQGRVPEYATMSRRPGLGKEWVDKYLSEVYPSDEVIVRGHQAKPPRYYDDQLAKEHPELAEAIKRTRKAKANNSPDNTGKRLIQREQVREARTRSLQRKL